MTCQAYVERAMAATDQIRPSILSASVRGVLKSGMLVYATETHKGWLFMTDEVPTEDLAVEPLEALPEGHPSYDLLMESGLDEDCQCCVVEAIVARSQVPVGLGLSGLPTRWPLRHIGIEEIRSQPLRDVDALRRHFAVTRATLLSSLMLHAHHGLIDLKNEEVELLDG